LISEPDVCVEALPLAGRVYAQLRLTESAQDCYRKYLAAHPDASLESFELGITYFERGDNQRAEELWGQILKREPAHPPALFYSGLLAAGEGRVDVARGHLEALFQACPPDNLYVHRGRELLNELARDSSLPRH
jgi:tetratricopeptide (TPR) repeat protein